MAAQLKVVSLGGESGSMDRQKALEAALAQIDRAFGKGSAMKLGSREQIEIDTISTGSLGLDIALGVGGLPRGRVVEIYGPESSGKTTLALHAIAEAQKVGGTAAFVDAEHALDPGYAKKLGVDIDELIVSQPDTGEQALEIVDTLVRSNAVDVLVVDSVAALKVRAFADELAALLDVPVRLCDERLSTVTAESVLRERGKKGQKRRQVVDQAAAVVILQNALDTERSTGEAPGEPVVLREKDE